MRNGWIMALAAIMFVSSIGCSSIRSTMLTRNETNTGWCRVTHLKGAPITLKVPTHLRVYVYQKHFMEQVNVAGVSKWQRVEMPTLYDFGSETLYTEQIFTTDFKRPAAGAFNLDVDFTSDQYLQKVQQDITDETLSEIGNLLGQLPGLFSPVPGPTAGQASGADGAGNDLREIKSVAAAGVFEVNAQDFEIQVQNFIATHLNGTQSATHVYHSVAEQKTPVGKDNYFVK